MDDADRERRCLLAFSLVPGLGAVRIARLIEHFGSVEAAWLARKEALLDVRGIGQAGAAAIVASRGADRAGRAMRRAAASGARIVTWLDAAYPVRLRGIPASPPVVYIRGAWQDGRPAVAIVGTRRATPYGMGVAERLAAALAARDVTIVSGLARGIDGAAHRAAVRSGGRTVGVLGCGVDVAYPPEHGSLMEAMVTKGGALMAEAPPGTSPAPGLFPARNRLISGLADAVVVIEGDTDSGAMITASRAIGQGRTVFAVPGSVYAPGSRGPHRLLAAGASVLTSPDDVLAVLEGTKTAGTGIGGPPGGPSGPDPADRRELGGLSEAERRVLAAVDPGDARSVDRVAGAAGIDVAAAAAALVGLEVRGAVRRTAGGLYVRNTAAGEATGGTEWRDHWS